MYFRWFVQKPVLTTPICVSDILRFTANSNTANTTTTVTTYTRRGTSIFKRRLFQGMGRQGMLCLQQSAQLLFFRQGSGGSSRSARSAVVLGVIVVAMIHAPPTCWVCTLLITTLTPISIQPTLHLLLNYYCVWRCLCV